MRTRRPIELRAAAKRVCGACEDGAFPQARQSVVIFLIEHEDFCLNFDRGPKSWPARYYSALASGFVSPGENARGSGATREGMERGRRPRFSQHRIYSASLGRSHRNSWSGLSQSAQRDKTINVDKKSSLEECALVFPCGVEKRV